MKIVRKKQPKILLVAAIVFAVLLASVIILNFVLTSEEAPAVPPEIIEGEAIYNGSALAYDRIGEENMNLINIKGKNGEYWLQREILEDGSRGDFILFYRDGNGEEQMYYPDIFAYDPNFEYTDLYATVPFGDYGNVPIITYLCVAIGTPYFDERFAVESIKAENDEVLSLYGLASTDDFVEVSVKYKEKLLDADGKAVKDDKGNDTYVEKGRKIKIGEPLATGGGYYFLIEGRNYIYSTRNNYFDYAMASFVDFINPILTAAGLPSDSAFEPYLTTGYEQYKNTVHTSGKVPSDSTVSIGVDVITPLIEYSTLHYPDGYLRDGFAAVNVNLKDAFANKSYSKLASYLAGKEISKLSSPVSVTLPDYTLSIEIPESGSVTKYYRITAVEAILRSEADVKAGLDPDITEVGTGAGEGTLYRVTYYLTDAEGNYETFQPRHGVIDVTSELIDEATRAKLSALNVGTIASGEFIDFSVTYTKENAVNRKIEMYITEIVEIVDADGKELEKVKNGATVVYHYYVVIDGNRIDDELVDKITVTDDLEGDLKDIADALRDRVRGDLTSDVLAYTYVGQYEVIAEFLIYEISEIRYYVSSDKIVSFKFQQASQRDPYYGESLYENTTGNRYNLYALNATACEGVVALLGGAGKNATNTTGLIGLETVAIGLTPDVMEEYGLYANTVYFELPRGITSVQYDENKETVDEYLSKIDDYSWYSTLGFTLYISDEKDGYRYIGSDLYDLVAKVEAEDFEYLDMSFVEFYARRNLILTSISNIKTFTVEYLMSDLYGTYVNELTHKPLYAYNGKLYTKAGLPEGALSQATEYDGIDVFVTPSGNTTANKLVNMMAEKGYTKGLSLYELYGKKTAKLDTLGTANFKEFIEVLFYTFYSGSIPKTSTDGSPSQDDVLANYSPVMRFKVTLGETSPDETDANSGIQVPMYAYDYVYEFYKYSDNEVLVRVYRQNRESGTIRAGEVADFYISNHAFKKLASSYLALLNGETVDNDLPFGSAGETAILTFGKKEVA